MAALKTARTDVLEIAYEESGPAGGPAVFLMHGFPDDVRTWDGTAPLLAQHGYAAGPEALAQRLGAYLKSDRRARIFLEMVKGDLHTRALFGVTPKPTPREIEACVREAVRIFCAGLAG